MKNDDRPFADQAVGAVINGLASPVEEAELLVPGEKVRVLAETAPLQGCAGSAIWAGLVTPGMKPFPAIASSTRFLMPAFVSAAASSAQVVVRRHVPTIEGCLVALDAVAAAVELLPAAIKSARKRPAENLFATENAAAPV